MDLVFIRHAQPERVEGAVGSADPELSETGRQQAASLAGYLAGEPIDVVVCSPLRRAVQTARPLAEQHHRDVIMHEGVAEYDKASGEYIPIEQLRAEGHPGFQDVLSGNVHRAAGVDPYEFRVGVVAAVEEIVDANGGRVVAVVCHGGVINAYLSHVLAIDDPTGFFYPNYTSIHRVVAARSGERTLLSINETCHLRGPGFRVGRFGQP
jgi:probable phosphoglycerate mutase